MKVGIGADHRGFKLKQKLIPYLSKKGYDVTDYGTDSTVSVDYPDISFKLGEAVRDKEVEMGIIICGTGVGVSIACNKVRGVRCAKVDNTNEAKMAREHNDANVMALSETFSTLKAKDLIDAFLKTEFSLEERHVRRVQKINDYK